MTRPSRRPGPAATPAVGGGLAAAGAVGTALVMSNAPWQAIVGVIAILALCATVLGVVQTIVPQDSPDRVTWSRDRLRHRTRQAPPRDSTAPERPAR